MNSRVPKALRILLIILGLGFLSFLLSNYNKQPELDQFFYGAKNLIQHEEKKPDPEKIKTIEGKITSTLAPKKGSYAVYIKDLKDNLTVEYQAAQPFGSASIYKLGVMYKTFDALEKKEIKKDTPVSGNRRELEETLSDRQTSDSDSATVGYPVEEALRLMITISDNYSALLLANRFGWANMEEFLEGEGIVDFKLAGDPRTTAVATAQILEKIYKGEAVSKSASAEMKKLLLGQTRNDRIPKYLPKNIKVAHKTGELDGLRNDAGIVFGKESDYIFVFLSDTTNTEEAVETIATLSKQVFDLLEAR